MNNIYKAVIRTKTSYLVHYNHNHDKLGRFAKSNGSSVGKRNIPFVSNYIHEIKDLKEKGVVGKYVSEMKDLKEKGIVGKYKSDVKKIIYGPEKPSETKKTSGIDHDELITSLEKIHDEGKKYPDKDLQEQAKIAGKIVKEEKDIIPVKFKSIDDIVGTAKLSKDQHKCSAFDGDVTVYGWTDNHSDGASIDVSGKSSTKTYKIETKSKNGVHLINSYKTDISFSDVGTSDGKAIDKHKLKELNDYSMSRESRKALDAGKKMASTQYLDTYKDWSSDPISRKLPDKYNNDNFYRDLYPQSINYKKNKKTKKPEIDVVYFVDKYDNFSGHVLGVYYEDGKPKTTMLEG